MEREGQQMKKANWLEHIGEGQKCETTCNEYIKYILFMGSKQRYLMRPLIVEIQGAGGLLVKNSKFP
jgi:hypothetical protein